MLLSHQQHLASAAFPDQTIALPLELAEVYSIYNGSLSTNHEHSELYLPMQDPEDQTRRLHASTRAYRGKRGRKTSRTLEKIPFPLVKLHQIKVFFHIAIQPTVFI